MTGELGIRRILRLSLTAIDLDLMRAFYGALGFVPGDVAPLGAEERDLLGLGTLGAAVLPLRLGDQEVDIVSASPPGRPYPEGSTATDLWFQHLALVTTDIDAAYRIALAAGAVPITQGGPVELPPNTGRVAAWKFRDPEGHPLELIHFPPGTGAAAWQRARGTGPLLGIDHTAISVGDVARSQAFYGGLGFTAEKGSHNLGPAQERLDAVAGVSVAVRPLRPAEAPPHVELLGYEVGTRRPMPVDTRQSDVWATRIVLEARAATAPTLRRDPDGHALVIKPPLGA